MKVVVRDRRIDALVIAAGHAALVVEIDHLEIVEREITDAARIVRNFQIPGNASVPLSVKNRTIPAGGTCCRVVPSFVYGQRHTAPIARYRQIGSSPRVTSHKDELVARNWSVASRVARRTWHSLEMLPRR